MKQLFIHSLFFAAIALAQTAQSNEIDSSTDRIYLQAGDLYMHEGILAVNLNGHLYNVNKVQSDASGVYIEKTALSEEWGGIWTCPRGHPNPPWALVCEACRNGW